MYEKLEKKNIQNPSHLYYSKRLSYFPVLVQKKTNSSTYLLKDKVEIRPAILLPLFLNTPLLPCPFYHYNSDEISAYSSIAIAIISLSTLYV